MFADLVIAPDRMEYASVGQLHSIRLCVAARVIRCALTMRAPAAFNRAAIAHDLDVLRRWADPAMPWSGVDRLTFERLLVDEFHRLQGQGVLN